MRTAAQAIPGEIARNEKSILVFECHALGMIAVIRSLGRAGYRVYAASSQTDALGFHSRFAAHRTAHPHYHSPDFLPWLERYVSEHAVSAIVPSEGFLLAIASQYEKYRPLLPDAAPLDAVRTCMSKSATQRALLAQDPSCPNLPAGGVVHEHEPLPQAAELAPFLTPFYLKADAEHAKSGAGALVIRCASATELLREMTRVRPHYSKILWQSHAPGLKVGVSLWRHQGSFMAENMTLGVHTGPHTGGMMSLRRSFWHEAILADAKSKMAALQWPGVAMMEYKWDPVTDRFWFIEINARYWGYLHLDLYAGKDFPRMQVDAFFGRSSRDLGPARRSVSCRSTLPGEMSYIASLLRDADVSIWRKLREALLFFALFLHPAQKADLLFPKDGRLYWIEWKRFLANFFRTSAQRSQTES